VHHPGVRLAIALAVLIPLAGCVPDITCSLVNCSPCPPSIVVFVQDRLGQPVPGVTVAGVPGSCAIDSHLGAMLCQARAPAGRHDLTFSAPGYASGSISVDVSDGPAQGGQHCCGTCTSGPPTAVELTLLP